ncbi:MAG: ice-binding family protein [Pseudomonadota bacterium]
MALLVAAFVAGCGGDGGGTGPTFANPGSPPEGPGAGDPGPAGPSPDLGLAAPFGIAATAGVTNTPTAPITTINGDVVLDPTLTCNAAAVPGGAGSAGFGTCGATTPSSIPVLNGTVIITGPTATSIKSDLTAAFFDITPPAGPPAAGTRGGATAIAAGTTLGEPTGSALVQGDNLFVPGLYQSITSILITGDLTLDAQGNSNAVFIFQSSSTVDTAAGIATPGAHTRILLVGGAKASNVWWQVGTSATLGTFSEFQGNILASADITMETGATSCGRLLAGAFTAGLFVFDSNVVSVPGHPSAPASCQ